MKNRLSALNKRGLTVHDSADNVFFRENIAANSRPVVVTAVGTEVVLLPGPQCPSLLGRLDRARIRRQV